MMNLQNAELSPESAAPLGFMELYSVSVSAHCFAVWLQLYCSGSLSALSQDLFCLQQAAVFRENCAEQRGDRHSWRLAGEHSGAFRWSRSWKRPKT